MNLYLFGVFAMAFMEIKLRSKVLGLLTNVKVILPEQRDSDQSLKSLWLLHGFSDDNTVWCRQTNIERYVENKELCVIMPAVDRSFYTDMVYGNKYCKYIYENLPRFYMCCCKDDFSYQTNLGYLKHLTDFKIPVIYEEEDGYAHAWDYWNLKIKRVLEWMGL